MTELELLIDLHRDTPRQGPGSDAMTLQMWHLLGVDAHAPLRVLDVGCGSGAQTLALARHTQAHITAVDLVPGFLERLDAQAEAEGLSSRVTTVAASMEDLDFPEAHFDVIWSEGAIYQMGFREGLRAWRRFLKPGGHIAVSELVWTTSHRPAEIEAFWGDAYSGIDVVSAKIRGIEEEGYAPLAHFILPPSCWTDAYYAPLPARMDAFLERHLHHPEAERVVEAEKHEIDMFSTFGAFYSYGFFGARTEHQVPITNE